MELTDTSIRGTFFSLLFGRASGFLCIAYMSGKDRNKFKEAYFKYPEDMPKALELIDQVCIGNNVYFCPQLFHEKKRVKEEVVDTPCAWADLDSCEPDKMLVEPTVTVESSPGRYQAYWAFDKRVDPDEAEDISRRIAYYHAKDGADRSGWDLTQLLRVPDTFNYKHLFDGSNPQVKIIGQSRNFYRVADFAEYPQATGFEYIDIPFPENIPADADALLQAKRLQINPQVWKLYQTVPPDHQWSQVLWQLEMLLHEAGFTREEVFAIAREAKCNKFARDNRSDRLLWKDVCRSYAKNEEHNRLIIPVPDEENALVTDEERASIERAQETFIERYHSWARSLGDAAHQYHQAGAFIALSALLAGAVRLPTSYGIIIPNLWFMILADTTLTRKTTAMDITMDMLMEVNDDVIMATDGSIEGLLTSLSTRPGKPSIFLRDEFSGLLEQMTKKDYMAGMPELLTKLYDGKMQKRILRKETIEVRDPRLIVFAGGIKSKILSLLTFEQVSSGFMPRFIFITAESDVTRLKPLGPPTEKTTGARDSILNELTDIHSFYSVTQKMKIKDLKAEIETQKLWNAQLTDDAWVRYNKFEAAMLQNGMASQRPEIMTPTYDRLAKSVLKAAILLSAARQREEIVTVTEEDVVRAMVYGETWRGYVREVMNGVGKSSGEKQLDNVLGAISRKPGVTRSILMQNYHLTAKEADHVFSTLEQRGVITRQRVGRSEQFFPTRVVA